MQARVTTLRNTTLGHDTFDAMHATAFGVNAALTNGIDTIATTLNNDAVTVSRAQLQILFRWSKGTTTGIAGAGADLNLGAATENDVTLSAFIDALVSRTLA
ncbi:MAG TPA: hypothetical protein VI959_00375 [Alphaproteobacteria bacterium]|nr:hypothetical protein [Alphaproteobacteria bacterium]